jgi:hypothetical protein
MAQACVRLSGCTHAAEGSPFRDPAACVDWWLSEPDPNEPLRRCLSAAGSCEQVATCVQGGGDPKAASFCLARPGVVSGCDGDRLVTCGEDDSHPSTVVDCGAMGATCREVKSTGGLVVRACYAPQKCPPGAPDSRCDGQGAAISCRDGAFERITCRGGTTCEEGRDESGEGAASCELRGARRCEGAAFRRCEQDRVVECERGGGGAARRNAKVTDCVAYGLHCTGIGPRAGCSVPSMVECDKAQLPKCDGSSLVFCAAGRQMKLPCPSLGFAGCDPAGKGAMAACTAGPPPQGHK